jgi:hypothetical protein
MPGADCFGDQLGDPVEGLAEGAIEALGEEFERGSFNADELSGVCGIWHVTEKMLAVSGKE